MSQGFEAAVTAVQAHAWVALGKLCLTEEATAKKCLPLFVQELGRASNPAVRLPSSNHAVPYNSSSVPASTVHAWLHAPQSGEGEDIEGKSLKHVCVVACRCATT